MLETWTLAVFGEMKSSSAIWRLVRPAATRRRTSRSRGVRPRDSARVGGGGARLGGRRLQGEAGALGEQGRRRRRAGGRRGGRRRRGPARSSSVARSRSSRPAPSASRASAEAVADAGEVVGALQGLEGGDDLGPGVAGSAGPRRAGVRRGPSARGPSQTGAPVASGLAAVRMRSRTSARPASAAGSPRASASAVAAASSSGQA